MNSDNNCEKLLSDQEILKIIENATRSQMISITDWSLQQREGELTGFLGTYWKLHVEAIVDEKKLPFNFFVKTMPLGSEQKEFMESTNLFHKETLAYSELLSPMLLEATHPFAARSHFFRNDILVLDDLTLDGYKLMPVRTKFSQKHIRVVLKSLAQMHAHSIHFEQKILKKSLDEVYDKALFEVSIDRSNAWFVLGLKTIELVALKKSQYSKDPVMVQLMQEKLMKGIDRIFDLVRQVPPQFRKVLCHRDLWRNNLMFKFEQASNDPVHCIFVDFQLARCMPPADDIMMALYVLQRSEERKREFQGNLKYYHECLETVLKELSMDIEEILPFQELIESCEYFKLLGAIIKAVYVQTTQFPEEEMKKLRKDDEKMRLFLTVDRSYLLQCLDKNEYFRECVLEAVEELVDMILFEAPH